MVALGEGFFVPRQHSWLGSEAGQRGSASLCMPQAEVSESWRLLFTWGIMNLELDLFVDSVVLGV